MGFSKFAATNPAGRSKAVTLALALIGPLVALWVWLSSLSFVPVPWPDDSAFYFVAKELFRWPPHWVMLPQAPFEPTYRIFNFNTMPLYPVLIGIGRWLGIDGSFLIKVWPLSFWAASVTILAVWLYRAGLPALITALIAAAMAFDPEMRWASVLVRPESLIGLFGMMVVLGISLGRFEAASGWYWDPIAALLALAAYAHFNAIHLLFAVVLALALQPLRLLRVGWTAALYLSPWALVALSKWRLFVHQMGTQWERLAVPNGWLDSVDSAIHSLFQALGSPEPWPDHLFLASYAIWAGIFAAGIFGLIMPAFLSGRSWIKSQRPSMGSAYPLVAPAGWLLGAIWLWNGKPEVWFVYYIHAAFWAFVGVAALVLWKLRPQTRFDWPFLSLGAVTAMVAGILAVFVTVDAGQAKRLDSTGTWHWKTYHDYVDCIDRRLTQQDADLGHPPGFRVWVPTFPDVTVELSRRHPDWDFSRTNDFSSRVLLALQHGHEVEAVVITETLNWMERDIDAPWSRHPEIQSVWMTWRDYFLNRLWTEPGWKPTRHLCQKGRWQAFIFMR